jgi:hypothetical protein
MLLADFLLFIQVVLLGRYNAQGFDQTIETAIKRVIVKAPEGSSISEDQSSQGMLHTSASFVGSS